MGNALLYPVPAPTAAYHRHRRRRRPLGRGFRSGRTDRKRNGGAVRAAGFQRARETVNERDAETVAGDGKRNNGEGIGRQRE